MRTAKKPILLRSEEEKRTKEIARSRLTKKENSPVTANLIDSCVISNIALSE